MDDAEREASGSYHRWNGTRLETFGGLAAVTNGPVVTSDGRGLYTLDTANGLIRHHEIRGDGIGEPRILIRFEEGWGNPDGLTLDAEGHLWICHYGAGRITRFTPEGEIERIVPVPTPLVTKCAFGGPDLSTLYITTCLRGRDPTLEPMAGHLYQVEAGVRGFAANLLDLSPLQEK